MFGAFKPTAPLSGGLLWKTPWWLSSTRKLRQRRRLRRVDNIVTVLDNALKRLSTKSLQTQPSSSGAQSLPTLAPNTHLQQQDSAGKATPDELSNTGEGLRMLQAEVRANLDARRHGRGPRQGEMIPEFTPDGVQVPGSRLLGNVARERGTIKLIERWKAEMPTEQEMLPKDKYTMFDKKVRGYRKGVHKLPKWTRVSQRVNPPGF